ncbi:MAG: cytochrome c [Chloroflexota bacterium]|nr:cytochrome c [Chloroflexota bacterium]MDE2703415.1 cytochrome c [Chloroflexota bacterium]MDE2936976.1 cytochrome c [Chloroflexota bacterium]
MPNRTEVQVAAVATLAALIVVVLAAVLVTEIFWRHSEAADHYRPYIDSPELTEFGIFSITAAAAGAADAAPVARSPELEAIYDIFIEKGCTGCHIVDGIPEAIGDTGPNLNGFASRQMMAGETMEVSRDNLASWLKDPPAHKADTLMPNLGLNDAEIDLLIDWLLTLT